MNHHAWPDALHPPAPAQLQQCLTRFWECLAELAGLLPNGEILLAAEQVAEARAIVIHMMLGLNGIQRPPETRRLNAYLSAAQRAALEKTLVAPSGEPRDWLGQAVALVVIYRWYAPQLVNCLGLIYPSAVEEAVWTHLTQALPDWPQIIITG